MFTIEFDLSLFTYLYLESFLPQGHNKNNDQVLHFVYIVFWILPKLWICMCIKLDV